MENVKYCESLNDYKRISTQNVEVGQIVIGDKSEVKLQSMTTTDTNDIEKTVAQTKRIIDAGAHLVRITAQGVKEAESLKLIKEKLVADGYNQPIVADIHFNPKAALIAAQYVEKVRINPGNYVDSKRFKELEYTDEEYSKELEKIKVNLKPLLEACKKHNTAIRIGANHGSLSDRIMSRYGDTPMGLVMSLIEFLRICKEEGFSNLVLSIKASNTRVMVQSCRLLVKMMLDEDLHCPLHLGVTEAGEGEDGRVKSAAGIGALLYDGIGDTVRVSLTEEPENEIPVAKAIVNHCINEAGSAFFPVEEYPFDPFSYSRRETVAVKNIGGTSLPVVVSDWRKQSGTVFSDYVVLDKPDPKLDSRIGQIIPSKHWDNKTDSVSYPLYSLSAFINAESCHDELNFVEVDGEALTNDVVQLLKNSANVVFLLKTSSNNFRKQRSFLFSLIQNQLPIPVVLCNSYGEAELESLQIKASCDFGGILIDGLVDGVGITDNSLSVDETTKLGFSLLQATRLRMSKTEYISCPSCGRTLFDIQDTVKVIKEKTAHLKSLKIAVMGCIVNGPGEMADADYGYVGAGPGKIWLYKEKNVVKKNVKKDEALDVLIGIIKENGDWVDPV